MFKSKLCPYCKNGKKTYELDKNSPVCPYLYCHNGKKCTMYKKIDKPKKQTPFKRIIDGFFSSHIKK